MLNKNYKSAGQRGFTLLEVLVAVIILGVGLLGIASLQAKGLRYNASAAQRTLATELAYDIIDRMRTNRPWRTQDDANLALVGPYALSLGETPTAAVDCATVQCNVAEIAAWDLVQWHQQLQDERVGLPSGTGSIELAPFEMASATPDGFSPNRISVVVTVQWSDDRDDPSNVTELQVESYL